MIGQVCNACGSSQTAPCFENLDYISGERFSIVRCTQCGLTRTLFPYDLSAMERYHGTAYYGERSEPRAHAISAACARMAAQGQSWT